MAYFRFRFYHLFKNSSGDQFSRTIAQNDQMDLEIISIQKI